MGKKIPENIKPTCLILPRTHIPIPRDSTTDLPLQEKGREYMGHGRGRQGLLSSKVTGITSGNQKGPGKTTLPDLTKLQITSQS